MKIAIDVSPLSSGHSVRGVGFYLTNLLDGMKKYYPENEYVEFTNRNQIPPDVDVIHYPYFDPFSITLPINTNNKVIVTVHDLTPIVLPFLFPVGIKGKLFRKLQKYLVNKTKVIITDSLSSKKDIVKLIGINDKQVEAIYLAQPEHFRKIEEKNILQKVKTKYNLPDKFSLYVGDVTPNKNILNAAKAAILTDIPLVMVGKALIDDSIDLNHPWTKDVAAVRALAKENTDKIILLGFVPNEDLVAIYNLASVFVMPSLYEGFGLPILEAMSCGCPVITSERGSLPDVAGSAALYVNPENTESIAEGIKKIFNDLSLRKKLQKGGIIQANKFSWQKTAEETIKAYKKLLEQK